MTLAVAVGKKRLPIEMSTAEVAAFLGRPVRTVRRQCEAGTLPTMPGGAGVRRVPTAKLLDLLGIAHEFVEDDLAEWGRKAAS